MAPARSITAAAPQAPRPVRDRRRYRTMSSSEAPACSRRRMMARAAASGDPVLALERVPARKCPRPGPRAWMALSCPGAARADRRAAKDRQAGRKARWSPPRSVDVRGGAPEVKRRRRTGTARRDPGGAVCPKRGRDAARALAHALSNAHASNETLSHPSRSTTAFASPRVLPDRRSVRNIHQRSGQVVGQKSDPKRDRGRQKAPPPTG